MWQWIESNVWVKDGLASAVVLLVMWGTSYLIDRALRGAIKDCPKLFAAKKANHYISSFITLLMLLLIWFQFAHSFVTFIGFFTAGVAIALREFFASLAAWIYLVTAKPFAMGDRISVNGHQGDVIDIRVLQFSLAQIADPDQGEQSTGAIVDLPNHMLFTHAFINQTKNFPYVWDELQVTLSLEADWQVVKEDLKALLVQETQAFQEEASLALKEASQTVGIFYRVLSPTIYLEVMGDRIVLTLRYLCPARNKRATRQRIWTLILDYARQAPQANIKGI